MLVFPIKVVCGVPLVGILVERMAHVVATVAAHLQSAGRAAVIINNVDTHHVAVAKAVVIDTGYGELVNLTRQLYAGGSVVYGTAFNKSSEQPERAKAPASAYIKTCWLVFIFFMIFRF